MDNQSAYIYGTTALGVTPQGLTTQSQGEHSIIAVILMSFHGITAVLFVAEGCSERRVLQMQCN